MVKLILIILLLASPAGAELATSNLFVPFNHTTRETVLPKDKDGQPVPLDWVALTLEKDGRILIQVRGEKAVIDAMKVDAQNKWLEDKVAVVAPVVKPAPKTLEEFLAYYGVKDEKDVTGLTTAYKESGDDFSKAWQTYFGTPLSEAKPVEDVKPVEAVVKIDQNTAQAFATQITPLADVLKQDWTTPEKAILSLVKIQGGTEAGYKHGLGDLPVAKVD